MSSLELVFDFAAANAELLANASLRAPHKPLGSAAVTAIPANIVLCKILLHSSGLKFCLFAMATFHCLLLTSYRTPSARQDLSSLSVRSSDNVFRITAWAAFKSSRLTVVQWANLS